VPFSTYFGLINNAIHAYCLFIWALAANIYIAPSTWNNSGLELSTEVAHNLLLFSLLVSLARVAFVVLNLSITYTALYAYPKITVVTPTNHARVLLAVTKATVKLCHVKL
jgi:hypothetical protein